MVYIKFQSSWLEICITDKTKYYLNSKTYQTYHNASVLFAPAKVSFFWNQSQDTGSSGFPPKKQASHLLTNLVYQLEAFLTGNYLNSCSDSGLRKNWHYLSSQHKSIPWLALLDMIQTMIIRSYIHTYFTYLQIWSIYHNAYYLPLYVLMLKACSLFSIQNISCQKRSTRKKVYKNKQLPSTPNSRYDLHNCFYK